MWILNGENFERFSGSTTHFGGRFARERSVTILLTIILTFTLSVTQSKAQFPKVGNKFVTAEVRGDNGVVTVYTTAGGYYGPLNTRLTFDQTSYLTIKLNGKYYTNNEPMNLGDIRSKDPNFAGYLLNGNTVRSADTLTTTWRLPQGELSQSIYPIEFDFSGQIGFKWKFKNLATSPASVQVQYLLDTRISRNDQAKVLTRSGYKRSWQLFVATPNINYPTIPSFYQAFENEIVPPNFNPGIASQGTLIDPELGLTRPDAVVVGQWLTLSEKLWGWPAPLPNEEYTDSAVLMQFGVRGVIPGITQELARTAYGTGEYENCNGELYGLIYRPRRLKTNKDNSDYLPNPFNVDIYLFNTNRFTEGANTTIKLDVGPHLKIVSPDPGLDSTSVTIAPDPSTVGLGSVSAATFKVRAENTCPDDNTWLRYAVGSSLATPNFVEGCELPLTLQCLDRDTLPPIADPEISAGFFRTMGIHDDRLRDKGLKAIRVDQFDPTVARVTVDPFDPCSKNKVIVRAEQIDTLRATCVRIIAMDCAGNETTENICFPKYPIHPDTTAPRILRVAQNFTFDGSACNMKYDSLLALDDTLYDAGLASIEVDPTTVAENMVLISQPFDSGTSRHGFALRVLDSLRDGCITIRATDRAGNFSTVQVCYCTIADFHKPGVNVLQIDPYTWSVFVNDDDVYDRKIDTIDVYNRQNVSFSILAVPVPEINRALTRGQRSFGFNVHVVDTTKFASFCIRAKDLADSMSLAPDAHWWSADTCVSRDTVRDIWAPNIGLNPPPFQSPTKIHVTIDDIHYYNGVDRIGWDRGIDSIWFTDVKGMIVPATIYSNCSLGPVEFDISVGDTLALDTISTICVHVIDCAGNQTDTCWYYPIRGDELPPNISGMPGSRTELVLNVTDSTRYDRGLKHIELLNRENFNPYQEDVVGDRAANVVITVTKPGESAVGLLQAIDLVGSTSPSETYREAHTSEVGVAIWVQDLKIQKSTLAPQNSDIRVPVYFSPNDTFSLNRKGIDEFEFAFELIGDPGFTYAGYDQVGTASDGFVVNDVVLGNRITVRASSLNKILTEDSIPLIYLIIHANASEITRKVNLTPVDLPIGAIIYNNNRQKTIIGKNATATIPAPYGTLGGGVIVSVGSCAPDLRSGVMPSIVVFSQPRPNPISSLSTLSYYLPEEADVLMSAYNAAGAEVARLVNSVQPKGLHELDFSAQGLPAGTYFIRLQASGKVITRSVHVLH